MWADFKKFALEGNFMDFAVAVVIGAAFGSFTSCSYYHTAYWCTNGWD